mmetsp:Transcript_57230/g.162324  ORF Transcript_57230/g.162324 Transcript_57230/m.162324 type:complete len:306 (+) Transcript_57230:129-1046(+)
MPTPKPNNGPIGVSNMILESTAVNTSAMLVEKFFTMLSASLIALATNKPPRAFTEMVIHTTVVYPPKKPCSSTWFQSLPVSKPAAPIATEKSANCKFRPHIDTCDVFNVFSKYTDARPDKVHATTMAKIPGQTAALSPLDFDCSATSIWETETTATPAPSNESAIHCARRRDFPSIVTLKMAVVNTFSCEATAKVGASRYDAARYCMLFCTRYNNAGTPVFKTSEESSKEASRPPCRNSTTNETTPFMLSCTITPVWALHLLSDADREYRIKRMTAQFCTTRNANIHHLLEDEALDEDVDAPTGK